MERSGDRAPLVQPVAHPQQRDGHDVHGVGDRDGHDDDRNPGIGGTERRAQPASEAHGRVDDEHEHQHDRHGAVDRPQQEGGHGDDHHEHDGHEPAQVVQRGIGKSPVHDHISGEVVVDPGMFGAGFVHERVEVFGDLDHRGVEFLRQEEVDHHPADAAVAGHQPAGGLHGIQGDRLHLRQLRVAQRFGAQDQRFDRQVVFERLAVGKVRQRIHAGGKGRLPRRIRERLDGRKRFACEHIAVPGRDGNQRPVGFGIGVLQFVERGQFRVVRAEHHPVIVGDGDVANARRHQPHDRHGHRDGHPGAVKNQFEHPVQPRGIRCHGYSRNNSVCTTRTVWSGARISRSPVRRL